MKTKQSLWKKLATGSGWAVFSVLIWELVEEGLEELIAYALSSTLALFVTKVLSTLAIITAAKGIKVVIQRFLLPVIKTLIYKEGNDKMEKLKKFFSWIFANKCTLGGVAVGALTAVTGAGVIDLNSFPALVVCGVNITPILYWTVVGLLTILVSFFPETIKKFKERVAAQKAEREQKALEKEAIKEIKAEEKVANQTQAEQEKAKSKAEKEQKTKEEKERFKAEHKAKVEAIKAEILSKKSN